MGNTDASGTRVNVKDVQFWGNCDAWKLLGKAWSKEEGWMKSSKAYEIPEVGCIVQVTTQNEEMPAEAITFVPGVKIEEELDEAGVVIGRKLVKM